jgi:hypothetical protein
MTWTTPRTWVNLEVVSHTLMNTHLRDNTQYLFDILNGVQQQNLSLAHGSADAVPTFLQFQKARGSIGSPAIVQSGDFGGEITFMGYDGGAYRAMASIDAIVDGTPGASDMPGRLAFYTVPDGSLTLTERMRITSAGQVLIGDGSAATPSFGFSAATTTGLARIGVTSVSLVGNGVEAFRAGHLGGVTIVGFHGNAGLSKQNISGSRGGNAALADLLTRLASIGLITDSTS